MRRVGNECLEIYGTVDIVCQRTCFDFRKKIHKTSLFLSIGINLVLREHDQVFLQQLCISRLLAKYVSMFIHRYI